MPFNNQGVYVPPAGAESAAPGQVIKSSVWNSIFTDIAAALSQLGQGQIVQNPTILSSAGNYTVLLTDTIILVQASVPQIILPAAATKPGPVTIIGNASGIFSANNSTLIPNGAEKIDGLATNPVLTVDYQSITILPLAAGGMGNTMKLIWQFALGVLVYTGYLLMGAAPASAQCTGVFPAGYVCGAPSSGSALGTPRQPSVVGIVSGPASATAGHVAVFSDTSGKYIADGGSPSVSVGSVGNAAADTSVTIAGTDSGPWTGAVTVKLNTANANTWSGVQTFGANDIVMTGATGCATFTVGVLGGTGVDCGSGGGGGTIGVAEDFVAPGDFTPGSTNSLIVSSAPNSAANTTVTFDGIVQSHDTWSLTGSTVTFNAAIPLLTQVVEIQWQTLASTPGVSSLGGQTGAIICNSPLVCASGAISLPGSPPLVVGSATIVGGALNSILYESPTGILGVITSLSNAVLGTNGSGAPSFVTTLPSSLTYPTPFLTGTVTVGTFVMTFPGVATTLIGSGISNAISAGGSTTTLTSAATGATNQIILANTGTSSNSSTVSQLIAELGCSNCTFIHNVTGGATPAGNLTAGAGLTGGLTVSTPANLTLSPAVKTALTTGLAETVCVVTASGSVTVAATDIVVIVNKGTGAATTVNLPSGPVTGSIYIIKDGKGDAATNNITISPASGNIDGIANYVINTAYGSATLVYNGTQWNVL